ncbi:MAG: 16S rRNA (cytosine(1402)-N(4))-methyltransferase RsmH [Lachnospiraceae bacterium]|nr:16S rRNA (cytosine(1402)-N(4))-methyltransferase RsmH [Lachnospiraceae bacterium]
MENSSFEHIPVMLEEVLTGLKIRKGGIYVDATVGGAGHSYEIAGRLETGRLICLDQDSEAIAASTKRLSEFGNRCKIIKSNYENIESVLADEGITKVSGILADLGVSSHQLDTVERGFSYSANAPLDMRMDTDSSQTAADIVNGYDERELIRVLRDYGEERFAPNIARNIIKKRSEKAIETTFELNEIINASIPMKFREKGSHPSKRTFQAIRIELNRELEVLEGTLGAMIDLLEPGGRLCIITFHSLEDRIVKTVFNKAQNPCICPPNFPKCVCGRVSKGTHISRKAILPTEEEIANNKRSKSAKLRIFEKAK